MNKERRKAIDAAMTDIRAASELIAQAKEKLGDAKDALEYIRDDEQEYFDAMPESIQSGDKGQAAEAAVAAIENAIEKLDEIIDAEFDADAIESDLDEAKG